jgi:hypothetical protein
VIEAGSRVERVLTLLRLTDRFRIYHSGADASAGREAAVD